MQSMQSLSMTNNKPLTERLLSLRDYIDKKDMLTVDLFSVYLLSPVDIVIRYIEVHFTFGFPDCVRYIEEFVIYIEVLFHTFYCNFDRDVEYRSLYRGLR